MKSPTHPSSPTLNSPVYISKLVSYLGQYITVNRKALIEKVLAQRTRHLTMVLEDIYQSHNASAVVRTCECMGLQDLHIVESKSRYSVNRKVLMGANKWLNLIRHNAKDDNNIEACYKALRQSGFTILATDPSPDGTPLDEISIDSKIALVMGSELNGISDYALRHADKKVSVPMFGFTESLNISVCAAICINTLIPKIRASSLPWRLTADEISMLRLDWYRKCVKRPEILERDFWTRVNRDQVVRTD